MYKEYKQAWDELTGPGGPFEIGTVNVGGVDLRHYTTAPPSLRELWKSSLQFGDADHLVYNDERWTFKQAHAEADAFAHWLVSQGVKPGDRVAICMRNYPEWMLAYWATVSIGAAVVGMNAWWVPAELTYGLDDAKPKVIVMDAERFDRFAAIRDSYPDLTVVGVRFEGDNVVPWSEAVADKKPLPDVEIDPDSDACIFYTSGTTGRPKGAQLTHRGCVNNVMSLAFAGALGARQAELRGLPVPDPESLPQSAALITTPLFHVTANNCVAMGSLLTGGKLVHMYKWNAGDALKLIEAERITALTGVPVMSRELITHPDFEKTDTSTLLSVGGGGAQLQPDLVDKIDTSVSNARPNTGYGMTETCGIITSINGDFFVDKPDSAGPILPNYESKIVDDSGREVAQGELGELCVRGAQVIRGYINRPEATAESIVDGWLHTGDIARIDEDGFVFIVDRKKDMVLRGGENVYCAEVESAVFEHDAVAECSVFGVPDDRLGEEVGIAVVLKADHSLTADELRAFTGTLIAKHKLPRYVWFLDELPRNASGKFLKRELRDVLSIDEAA
ncbi:MAG: acyl--CoA ligase [Pseudomonadaceae bacterium]|nr:acyl--CoA ligase [Pseudomonadaceae bacterium]